MKRYTRWDNNNHEQRQNIVLGMERETMWMDLGEGGFLFSSFKEFK